MNLTSRSGRPSRNSQGICNTSLQPTMPTILLPETPVNTVTVPHTLVITPQTRSTPSEGSSSAVMDTSNSNTPVQFTMQDREVEVLTPCTRQYNRFPQIGTSHSSKEVEEETPATPEGINN